MDKANPIKKHELIILEYHITCSIKISDSKWKLNEKSSNNADFICYRKFFSAREGKKYIKFRLIVFYIYDLSY